MTKLVIRVDDIHPRMKWATFMRFVEGLSRRGLTATLGVIPECMDAQLCHDAPRKEFWDTIRQLSTEGWIVAQHGYRHVYDISHANYLGIRNRSEFAGHPLDIQAERLAAGAEILLAEGLRSDVFMAPWHTFDNTTLKALERTGFRYVTDGYGFWPYSEGELIMVPQLFARPHGWRLGVYTSCIHLDGMSDVEIERMVGGLQRFEVVSLYEAAKLPRPLTMSVLSRHATKTAILARRLVRDQIKKLRAAVQPTR
ncbi:DUF2334 domain-containing protein [Mesorhizobium temperatum]|uniref:DUF2334 domain-containing protein n=1 Tax=Mesorhizobium temperatum TaxID=241416 RepID=A0A271LUE7_9HYPH|nr:DUF2334 domain-containing protein [Mesorhizobium temperatum]PAQ10895.1 hypothetical protein CIT26_06180 [Mesorhizobium temperatum]